MVGLKIIQDQVGHKHASTTSIYTGVSDEYRNQLLQQSLRGRLGQMWGELP
jgi:integrase/recombinase XerC